MIKGQNWSNANYPLKQSKNNQIFPKYENFKSREGFANCKGVTVYALSKLSA